MPKLLQQTVIVMKDCVRPTNTLVQTKITKYFRLKPKNAQTKITKYFRLKPKNDMVVS